MAASFPSSRYFWLLAFAAHLAWGIWLAHTFSHNAAEGNGATNLLVPGAPGFFANDYAYFFNPARAWVETGQYTYRDGLPFAGRMPGLAIPYALLRIAFSHAAALSLIIWLQIVLASAAAIGLARFVSRQHKLSGWVMLVLGFLYPCGAFFHYLTQAESLAISSLTLAWLALLAGSNAEHAKSRLLYLCASGLLLAWCVFLRPFLGLLWPIWTLAIWRTKPGRGTLAAALVFALPIFLALGGWSLRNYIALGKVVVLETPPDESYGPTYSRGWLALRELIATWGGEPGYFEPHSEAQWFRREGSANLPLASDHFVWQTGCFTPQDLIDLRTRYQAYRQNPENERLDNAVVEESRRLKHCLDTTLTLPQKTAVWLGRVRKLVFRSGSSYMPGGMPAEPVWRVIWGGLYYLHLALFVAALSLVRRDPFVRLSFVSVVAISLGILLVTPMIEHRYFLVLWPLILWQASNAVQIWNKNRTFNA